MAANMLRMPIALASRNDYYQYHELSPQDSKGNILYDSFSPVSPQSRRTSQHNPFPARRRRSEGIFHWPSFIYDTWWVEVGFLAMSIACFVAIAIVLEIYDGERMPRLSRWLSLNAIISLLATTSKSCLLSVVASTIGQLKWYHFSKGAQQILDIQRFDSASRGPLGSISMLLHMNRWSMTTFGALITILALLYDPFVQQVISYPLRLQSQSSDSALAPNVSRYTYSEWYNGIGVSNFVALLDAGIIGMPDSFLIPPRCLSENCTWPIQPSLAWCYECEDAQGNAQILDCGDLFAFDQVLDSPKEGIVQTWRRWCMVSLGHGVPYNLTLEFKHEGGVQSLNLTMPTDIAWRINFNPDKDTGLPSDIPHYGDWEPPHDPALILGYVSLNSTDFRNLDTFTKDDIVILNATECAIGFCVQHWNYSVINGRWNYTTGVHDWGSRTTGCYAGHKRDFWHATSAPIQSVVDDPDCKRNTTDDFVIGPVWDFTYDVSTYFAGATIGSPLVVPRLTRFTIDLVSTESTEDAATQGTSVRGSLSSAPYTAFPNSVLFKMFELGLEFVMDGAVSALTYYGVFLKADGQWVKGQSITEQVHIAVQWRWLSLPLGLIVGSAAFLAMAIVLSAKHKLRLWKNSSLALLYHGLDDGLRDGGGIAFLEYNSVMKEAALANNVRLRPSVGGTGKTVLGV